MDIQDLSGYTAFHWAIEKGNEAFIELLLSREDVDVNAQAFHRDLSGASFDEKIT